MFLACRHIKPNGLRCQSPALRGGPFCYFHARLYNRTTGDKLAIHRIGVPDMRNPDEIHTAIRETVNAYLSSRVSRRSAGLLLYALQIAVQNLDRPCLDRSSAPPAAKPASPAAPPKKRKSRAPAPPPDAPA